MPKGWDGQSRGGKFGYAVFIFLLKKAGIRPAYFLLRFVALYFLIFVGNARRPIWDLYRHKLNFSFWHSFRLLYCNFFVFGQTLIDKFAIRSGSFRHFKISRTGAQYLNELVAGGKGGLLVSAHLGNWELAGHLLHGLDAVINIVMYDGEQKHLKHYLEQQTKASSFNIILIGDDLSHIYEIAAALNRNELICIHADRFVADNRTLQSLFLSHKASFPLGPFALAAKLKAPVCFVFALKESKFHYHFYGFPPKVYEGKAMTGGQQMLNEYVSLLEQQVMLHPEQWFNYYDFWANNE